MARARLVAWPASPGPTLTPAARGGEMQRPQKSLRLQTCCCNSYHFVGAAKLLSCVNKIRSLQLQRFRV